MKFKEYIEEEYYARGQIEGSINDRSFEIFKNPSTKEYKEVERTSRHNFMRILINRKTKDIYLATGDCLHDEIAKAIDEEEGTDYTTEYNIHYYPLILWFETEKKLIIKPSSVAKFNKNDVYNIVNTLKDKTIFDTEWMNN